MEDCYDFIYEEEVPNTYTSTTYFEYKIQAISRVIMSLTE
jgi:hypothetical protein